jgi:3-dehydroquinate synthase
MKQFELTTRRLKTTQILIGKHIISNQIKIIKHNFGSSCLIIIDEHVYRLYPSIIEEIKTNYAKNILCIVPSGEKSKSLTQFNDIINTALNSGVKRNTVVYAIGGGVTGDLAGFVASSLLRGLPLVHIPTTLLAMVDSSIGGKTGINHSTGKNLIGAFYQPDFILMDVDFVKTLPSKEWNCGLGEILKYGCISDQKILVDISGGIQNLSQTELQDLIFRCAKIKSDIVMQDELESGKRAFLNFGHTFAHALESFTKYERFAHGEAVFVGLIAATWLSNKMGANLDLDKLLVQRNTFKLQVSDLLDHIDELTEAMMNDKKVTGDLLRLIILSDWETPKVIDMADLNLVHDSWKFVLSHI